MFDLKALQDKIPRYVVGLVSGASCDGIDAVLVRLKGTGPEMAIRLLASNTFPYTEDIRLALLSEHKTEREVCQLNFQIGELFAQAGLEMIKIAKEQNFDVDLIASHGHTIAHLTPPTFSKIGTLQIGEPAIIAERTGLPVVSDFRARDMAAGGQGAPLMPYADWILFRRSKRTILCINIGGLANMAVITPEFENIFAFDTGPGNMIIDSTVRLLTRGEENMDRDGRAAKHGQVIDEFLEYLLDHPFFIKVPPKAASREDFSEEVYLRDALASRKEYSFEDLVATVTTVVVRTIVDAYERFVKPKYEIDHVIIGGGGAKNKTIFKWIARSFAPIPVFTSDQYGIPNSCREALAFAILGNETICGTPANIPQVTGASHPVILGKITPP
ncbi:MAG TPA: anhydro-N-acetylmuramic acid kinase [Candidatus Hydrogenedens sp.]|nr:anhydro-N-acetylmuramic acid kinase [Candidatus Hydrogenedens sp.]HOK09583.1 anhydro-N-acetylmuramic acid kinase [Candidatus Hydrogenedens sp.]HOL18819.1 anhydro-N-acetylmuramic acid kinase [Candidatus Hydrogenedens sp.]HPP59287.1 anhydro-N-acetylmuramic acid kinase [Candidatus Hydrogenedens sp.]